MEFAYRRLLAIVLCALVCVASEVYAAEEGGNWKSKCPAGYIEAESVSGGAQGPSAKGGCVKKESVTDDAGNVCEDGVVAFPNISTGQITRYCKDDFNLTKASNAQACDSVSKTCASLPSGPRMRDSEAADSFRAPSSEIGGKRMYGDINFDEGVSASPPAEPSTPSERFLREIERISEDVA